jgi:uncharacterized protein (DUF2235 family)
MQNWRPGDKICIFGASFTCIYAPSYMHILISVYPGFSRGAYTARALAGFVHKVCASTTSRGGDLLSETLNGACVDRSAPEG